MSWIVGFRASISKMPTLKNTGVFLLFCFIFLPLIPHERLLQSLLTIPFFERAQEDFSGSLEYFA